MDEQANTPRRMVLTEVWETVKADYLAGMSGPDCCRRHGVALSSLRDRAAREGWRRSDRPWVPPHALDPWDEGLILEERIGGNLDLVEWGDLSHVVDGRMMRAILRGDAAEFMRWHKVIEIVDVREAELRRWAEEEEVRKFHVRQRARDAEADAADPDSTDYPDSDLESDLEDQGPIAGFMTLPYGGLARKEPREDGDAHVSSPSLRDGEETWPG